MVSEDKLKATDPLKFPILMFLDRKESFPQLHTHLHSWRFYSFSFLAATAAILLLPTCFAFWFSIIYIKESFLNKEKLHPIAGTFFDQLINFNTYFDFVSSLSRKNPTFRFLSLTNAQIYTSDPTNVEYILKTNFTNYGKGPFNYSILRDLLGDGIFAVDGDRWKQQRKLASYEFSTKVLRDFSSNVFRKNAEKLAGRVSEAAIANEMFDLQDLLMRSTLDSIFKVGFGVELNSFTGSDEKGTRFRKAFDDSNAIVYWRYADILWKVKKFLNVGSEAILRKNIKLIDNFVFEVIRCKREQIRAGKESNKKEDILSRFLMASEQDQETMTDQYLRDIILNFMFAGKDSTAGTLTWFFYMLCKNPLIQEKIAREVREAVNHHEDRLLADDFAESLTETALNKMQYLHAALTETLRLYPAVPLDGKGTESDDVWPDGFKVRKGDFVNYAPYAMGRMTYIWGEDAEDFRPERWLENGVFRAETPFKFTAFQAGPRICLGKEFAYRQMKIIAALLLHLFKFELSEEGKEAKYRTMITLYMDQGLHLLAFHRSM